MKRPSRSGAGRGASRGRAGARGGPPGAAAGEGARRASGLDHRQTLAARELFWHNVLREMLTALSVVSLRVWGGGDGARGAPGQPGGRAGTEPEADLFDGRLGVITADGARLGIARVTPLFACGVPTDDASRMLSMAVECSVFQIETPEGEVFTLPLHEIRAFHALSEELMGVLREAARGSADATPQDPFGFAAFTSLSRGRSHPGSAGEAPI